MNGRPSLFFGLLFLAGGCVTGPDLTTPFRATPAAKAPPSPLGTVVESVQSSWKGLTQAKAKPLPAWEWATALPSGAGRAEVIAPVLSEAALVPLLPAAVKPVSHGKASHEYRITAVNEVSVGNCNQLHAAVTRALAEGKKTTVTVNDAAASGSPKQRITVEPAQLVAVTQDVAPGEHLLRITDEGNPWVVLREGGVRCKALVRVERERRLLQLALSLAVCRGPQTLLPKEVRASCGGTPLQCLSVAETLETLYVKPENDHTTASRSCSFAEVSELDDYRIPTNYKRIQQSLDDAAGNSVPVRREPALAVVPGLSYPGPALLGDARALSAFLLQRQLYQEGQPERVGWIMFSGDSLRQGGTIEVQIDLGQGFERLSFTLPRP